MFMIPESVNLKGAGAFAYGTLLGLAAELPGNFGATVKGMKNLSSVVELVLESRR